MTPAQWRGRAGPLEHVIGAKARPTKKRVQPTRKSWFYTRQRSSFIPLRGPEDLALEHLSPRRINHGSTCLEGITCDHR